MTHLIATLLIVTLFFGCQSEPRFELEENSKNQFAHLPGKIGVTLEANSVKWHRIIEGGVIIHVGSLQEAPPQANAVGIGYLSGATGLPEAKGYDYRGPYLASPDNRLLAASIAAKEPSVPGPAQVVIIDVSANRMLSTIGGKSGSVIEGIAWSPDSKWLAVLRNEFRHGRGPLDQIIAAFGHPVPYMSYYLEVVDLSGKVVASTKLVSDLRASWGEVVWIE
jgi:hypothetical protein